ncbi:hypothetical protein [Streptomyces sp. NPDC005953]|uniref:hypothetical protein n=1 Tax=Streptomyces sp. NPDC005953 TaxID=3156719 RepID=UPI0033C636C3
MSGPSSAPRPERAGRPGTHWNTQLGSLGEQLLADDAPDPQPNRATRRALTRRKRR